MVFNFCFNRCYIWNWYYSYQANCIGSPTVAREYFFYFLKKNIIDLIIDFLLSLCAVAIVGGYHANASLYDGYGRWPWYVFNFTLIQQ